MTQKDNVIFQSLLAKQLDSQSSVQIDMISIDKAFWAPNMSEMRQQVDEFCAHNGLTVEYASDGRSVTFTRK